MRGEEKSYFPIVAAFTNTNIHIFAINRQIIYIFFFFIIVDLIEIISIRQVFMIKHNKYCQFRFCTRTRT